MSAMRILGIEIRKAGPKLASEPEGSVINEELSNYVQAVVQGVLEDFDARIKAATTALNRIERKLNRDIQSQPEGDSLPRGDIRPSSSGDITSIIANIGEGGSVPEDLVKHL